MDTKSTPRWEIGETGPTGKAPTQPPIDPSQFARSFGKALVFVIGATVLWNSLPSSTTPIKAPVAQTVEKVESEEAHYARIKKENAENHKKLGITSMTDEELRIVKDYCAYAGVKDPWDCGVAYNKFIRDWVKSTHPGY